MAETPKWQRARHLGDDRMEPEFAALPGYPFLWVETGPPERQVPIYDRDSGKFLRHDDLVRTHARDAIGRRWTTYMRQVELLPEFSYADDPDAEHPDA
jgi:hypothetical protein